MRVLIADDNTSVRSALCLMLKEAGDFVIAEASDANDLLVAVKEECPDLVLLDWDLPGITDGEIIPALRAICPGLPVVVLSSSPEVKAPAFDAGASDFLDKASPPDKVRDILGKHLPGGKQ